MADSREDYALKFFIEVARAHLRDEGSVSSTSVTAENISSSTAYRTQKKLEESGIVNNTSGNQYILGEEGLKMVENLLEGGENQ